MVRERVASAPRLFPCWRREEKRYGERGQVKDLRACLEDYSLPMLRALADTQSVRARRDKKAELIDRLVDHLARPEVIAMNLSMLGAAERAALEQVVAGGGKVSLPRLEREFGPVRQLGAGGLERHKPWRNPQTATERLYYLGLLYIGYAAIGDYRGKVFFVPPEILAHLPAPSPASASFDVQRLSEPPAFVKPADRMAVYDVFVHLSVIQRYRPIGYEDGDPERPGYGLPAAANVELEERLSSSSAERKHQNALLERLARSIAAGKPSDDAFGSLDIGAIRRWLEQSPEDRLLALQNAWREDPYWNELWHVPTLKPEDTGWRNDPRLARRHILRHLADCPICEWLSLPSFVQAIKQVEPDFQRPDGDYGSWFIRDRSTGRYLTGFESWDYVEGALITYVIAQPCRWLGLVDVGFPAEDRISEPIAFRITEAGARFLGRVGKQTPRRVRKPSRFVVHPDMTVDVPADASWWDRFHLERLAVLQELHDDLSVRYLLTEDDLLHLLEHGVSFERVVRFLQRASGETVPPSVLAKMRAWRQRYGQVVIGKHLVMETASAQVLQRLRAQPQVAKHIIKVVGPQTALIRGEAEEELVQALREAGHVPRRER